MPFRSLRTLPSHRRLLLAAAALPATPSTGETLGFALRLPDLDWRLVLSEAIRHGAAQKLYLELTSADCSRHVPEWAMERLARMYAGNERRNRVLLEAAARFARGLEGQGIRFLLLKGGALAANYYPDLASRNMADVDLLVPPTDFEAALQTGASLGFRVERSQQNPDPIHELLLFEAGEDILSDTLAPDCDPAHAPEQVAPFCRLAKIEVHRAIGRTPDRRRHQGDLSLFWEHSEKTNIAGMEPLRVPCPEALLVHLGIHSAYHGFGRLVFGMDIALVLKNRGEKADWNRLHRIAVASGLSGHVWQSLDFAQRLFGASVPPEAIAPLAPYSRGLWHVTIQEVFRNAMDNQPRVWWSRLRGWPSRAEALRAAFRATMLVAQAGSGASSQSALGARARLRRIANLLRRVVKSAVQP